MEQKVAKKEMVASGGYCHCLPASERYRYPYAIAKKRTIIEKYDCNVYLKREDLQVVRSFKLRGAYYAMKMLPARKKLGNGVICASAGIMLKVLHMHVDSLKSTGKFLCLRRLQVKKFSRLKCMVENLSKLY